MPRPVSTPAHAALMGALATVMATSRLGDEGEVELVHVLDTDDRDLSIVTDTIRLALWGYTFSIEVREGVSS